MTDPPWHIRQINGFLAVKAFCGEMVQIYDVGIYPREVAGIPRQGICPDCLESPDYAIWLLAQLDQP